MPADPDIFLQSVAFDPAGDFETFVRQAPARWVVYLLTDEADRPIQLLCVKNFRYSLKRRLGGEETIGPSRKVNYREIVRHIHWRRVDSAFEADWWYYEAARKTFPESYQGMVGFRLSWFLHINPEANFPRYTKTTDLSIRTGMLIGPVEDKHAANKLIEMVEDLFDLCRFYNILIEAPHGKACAYKEMGKCPAPCDGSISMMQYRRMIEWSAQTLVEPAEYVREQTGRMQQAATDLQFEAAGKIKTYLQQLSQLDKPAFRYVARLKDFQFLALQRGPKEGTAKVFIITPGGIEEMIGIINDSFRPAEVMRIALERSAQAMPTMAGEHAERIGIVTHHLFSPKATQGVFLAMSSIDEKKIAKAFRDLQKQKLADETEDEGVVKELQAM